MAQNSNFRDFMSPNQAPTQPMMEWMPWDDQQQQQGADLGSILGQLKPQGGGAGAMGTQAHGAMDGASPLHGLAPKSGGGKSSL